MNFWGLHSILGKDNMELYGASWSQIVSYDLPCMQGRSHEILSDQVISRGRGTNNNIMCMHMRKGHASPGKFWIFRPENISDSS